MRVFITVLVLIFSFQSWTKADDIRDFEIEGMSIGDSLLDYMSAKIIKEEFLRTKNHYIYLKKPNKFREVYITNANNFETYRSVSFYVKPNDKNYIIFGIRGLKTFLNSMDICLKKREEIVKEIENIIPKFTKKENNFNSTLDKSGQSPRSNWIFTLPSGDSILISCNDWEEKLRKKNNWTEGLSVILQKKEVQEWFFNRK